MEDVIALVDEIIEEHEAITQKVQTLEQVVTKDVEAIISLMVAEEASAPVRRGFELSLREIKELLETTSQGLQAHFNREETALLTASFRENTWVS